MSTDILAERTKRGISQLSAAKEAGIGRSTFAEWEVKGYTKLAEAAEQNVQVRSTKERIDAWLQEDALPAAPEDPDSDLKRERKRRGVSQEEASRQAGIPPTTWRRWEKQGPIKLEGYDPDTSRGKARAWLEGEPVVEPEGLAFEVLPEASPDPEIETYRAIAAAIPDHRPALAAALVSFADKLQASRAPAPDPEPASDSAKTLQELCDMVHLVADEVQATRAMLRSFINSQPDVSSEVRSLAAAVRQLGDELVAVARPVAGSATILVNEEARSLGEEVRGVSKAVGVLIDLMKKSEESRQRDARKVAHLWAERREELKRQEAAEAAKARELASRMGGGGSSLHPNEFLTVG